MATVIGTTVARMMFGAVTAAALRRLVPNCSEAFVRNSTK
jgi:hypothetical protein